MPRAAASDPLHSFRYHAKSTGGPAVPGAAAADLLQPDGTGEGYTIADGSEAGFNSITTPEITVETAEYREGNRVYTAKFPGVPTIGELTLNRGVALRDTAFFNWVLAAIEGSEYRTDLTIYHIQRPSATDHAANTSSADEIDAEEVTAKLYKGYNCLPARIKIAADMDASTSDVSIAELDVALERFDVEIVEAA